MKVGTEAKLGQPGSCHSGTAAGYSVEARMNYTEPARIGDIILDAQWRRIYFAKSPIGIPPPRWHQGPLQEFDLLSFEGAQALRWWFIAEVERVAVAGSICLETRLIEHKVKFSYAETPEAIIDQIDDIRKMRRASRVDPSKPEDPA